MKNWHFAVLVLSVLCAATLLVCIDVAFRRTPDSQDTPVLQKKKHSRVQHITPISKSDQNAVMVCLILSSYSNASLTRMVRVLNYAYMPTDVSVHLAIVSSTPIAIKKDAWLRGNCVVFRNLSLVRFRSDLCFILVQDTMDIGPYFLYWMWRAWTLHRASALLIAGDSNGTGLIPRADAWVRFVRSERVCRDANVPHRYLDYFMRTIANATILRPPMIDGYAVIRPDIQPITEREREPKLARVWKERFILDAIWLRP